MIGLLLWIGCIFLVQVNLVFSGQTDLKKDSLDTSLECQDYCDIVQQPSHSNDAKSTAADGFSNAVPSEIKDVIFRYLSLSDMSKCQQVCKQWHHAISHSILDGGHYSSRQDFLQQIAEQGDEMDQRLKSLVSTSIVHDPFTKGMCSVPLLYWFSTVARLGHFKALDQWFHRASIQRNTRDLSYLFSTSEQVIDQVSDHGQAERLIQWYLDKIQHLYFRHSGVYEHWRLSLVQKALERTSLSFLQHANLTRFIDPPSNPHLWLEYAAKNRDPDVFAMVMNVLRQYQGPFNQELLVRAFAQCRTCRIQDVQHVVQRLGPDDQHHMVSLIILESALDGNIFMLKLLLDQYEMPVTASLVTQVVVSGQYEVVQWLLSVNPALVIDYDTIIDTASYAHRKPLSLNVVNDYILSNPPLSQDQVNHLILLYAKYACGNTEDMAALNMLLNQPGIQVNESHLIYALKRTDFVNIHSYPSHHRICKKSESMQIIQLFVQDYHIVPQVHHLALALQRGRLDIVKFLYHQARLYGSPFHTASWMFNSLLGVSQVSDTIGSYQETELIEFLIDQMVQQQSTLPERTIRGGMHVYLKGLLEVHPIPSHLDCFHQFIRTLK